MRRLKILWLSHFVPYPPKGGAFQRSYNLLREVGAAHELHLLAIQHKIGTHPAAETSCAANELGRFCASVKLVDGTRSTRPTGLARRALRLATGVPLTVSMSDIPAMRDEIRSLIRRHRFDAVHFDTIGLATYRREVLGIPALLSHHGPESFMMLRRTKLERNWLKRSIFLLEGLVLRRYEAKTCPQFVENIVVSDLDAHLLRNVAANISTTVVPNGVDIDYFYKMPHVSNHNVVFAGRLDQYSNRDAILFFARETWPRIRAAFPDAVLDVLGSKPPDELSALARRDRSIRVHGFVVDVRPYFEAASLAICPIRDGGGTRLKILDTLAMGKPIVTTTIGIEGIDVLPERDLLAANSPAEFATQVSRVFTDEALRASLSTNARKLAVDRYSWTRIAGRLLDAYERASAARERPIQ